MAGIRIFINSDFKKMPDNPARRIASNLANLSAQASATAAVNVVKKSVYNNILPPAYLGGNSEYVLSQFNKISPYNASDNRFPVRNYMLFEDNNRTIKVELWDVRINTTFENQIVKTAVTKRKGTIKEFISANDYSFTISGSLISNSQYHFPLDELKAFIELFQIEENMSVSNVLINSFGVTKVVLESCSIPQDSQKYINTVNFNMKLLSDTDVQLSIVEERE